MTTHKHHRTWCKTEVRLTPACVPYRMQYLAYITLPHGSQHKNVLQKHHGEAFPLRIKYHTSRLLTAYFRKAHQRAKGKSTSRTGGRRPPSTSGSWKSETDITWDATTTRSKGWAKQGKLRGNAGQQEEGCKHHKKKSANIIEKKNADIPRKGCPHVQEKMHTSLEKGAKIARKR